MRSLLFVPTVHDSADTNTAALNLSLPSPLIKARFNIVGDRVWKSIDRKMLELGEDLTGVKVFLEGDIAELEIHNGSIPFSLARTLMAAGSIIEHGKPNQTRQTNLSLALRLAGAKAIRVEDLDTFNELNLQYRQLVSMDLIRGLVNQDSQKLTEFNDISVKLERLRSSRNSHWEENVPLIIDENLGESERGILVVGGAHDPVSNLSPDINVTFVSDEAKFIWNASREGRNPPWIDESEFRSFLETNTYHAGHPENF
jgi:hypothetical protein